MMHTSTTVPLWPPAPGIAPELARLVDAGVLARAARDDGAREAAAFDELARATRRGELTVEQASALAALLGLGTSHPANDG